jgi:hypothetical protein
MLEFPIEREVPVWVFAYVRGMVNGGADLVETTVS